MATYKVVDADELDAGLETVANAIRTKGGTGGALSFPSGFAAAVEAISSVSPTITVTTSKVGATVTATKGNITVSGTTGSDGIAVLTVPELGEWTVVATYNGQTSTIKVIKAEIEYSVTVAFAGPTLNDNDWDTIRAVSDAGDGANYWSVGDRKAVVLNGTVGALTLSNVTNYAFIIGFNHNLSVEGSGRIHFQLGKTAVSGGTDVAFCDSKYGSAGSDEAFRMSPTNTNSGGWKNSYMRKTICLAFKNVLPAALKNAIKSVTKYTDNTGNSSAESAVTETTDEIFLLAEYEVFGTISRANTNESSKQAQYAYYSAGNSKIKYNHSATTTPVIWWLRSPYTISPTVFVLVNTGGTVDGSNAYASFGFAPCFCV